MTTHANCWSDETIHDFPALVQALQAYLKIKTHPIGMKRSRRRQDDELLIALPPSYLPGIVSGLEALSGNGLRYPIPNHGLDVSPLASMARSYG